MVLFFSAQVAWIQQFNPLYTDVLSRLGPFLPQKYACEQFFYLYDKEPILYVLTIKSAAISNDSYEIKEYE